MYCTKCGNKLEENSKFCPACGNNMDGTQTTTINNNEKEKVSFGKCFLQCLLVAMIVFILSFFVHIYFLQVSLPILIILFGPFILYVIRKLKNK